MRYYWNFDEKEEVWHNAEDTIEACIEEAKLNNEKNCKFVFIGEVENHIPVIDPDITIEILQEDAYQECGECSEGWLDNITKEQNDKLEEKLNDALQEWLKETNNIPYFGNCTEINCYEIETGKKV